MFDRLRNLLAPPERKASRTARLIAIESGGRARWTPRDYAALAREGYQCNAIVHRAVRLIAESIGSLSFVLYEGAAELDRASAARSPGAAESAPGRRVAFGSRQLAPAARRQRLCRGGRHRRRHPAKCARALRAAARPHESGAGAGRLAAGLRIYGGRIHRALRARRSRCRRSYSSHCSIRSTIITG